MQELKGRTFPIVILRNEASTVVARTGWVISRRCAYISLAVAKCGNPVLRFLEGAHLGGMVLGDTSASR